MPSTSVPEKHASEAAGVSAKFRYDVGPQDTVQLDEHKLYQTTPTLPNQLTLLNLFELEDTPQSSSATLDSAPQSPAPTCENLPIYQDSPLLQFRGATPEQIRRIYQTCELDYTRTYPDPDPENKPSHPTSPESPTEFIFHPLRPDLGQRINATDFYAYLSAPKGLVLNTTSPTATMITDNQLYSLSTFLGMAAMLMIVLYHFLEVNAEDSAVANELRRETSGVGAVRPEGDVAAAAMEKKEEGAAEVEN